MFSALASVVLLLKQIPFDCAQEGWRSTRRKRKWKSDSDSCAKETKKARMCFVWFGLEKIINASDGLAMKHYNWNFSAFCVNLLHFLTSRFMKYSQCHNWMSLCSLWNFVQPNRKKNLIVSSSFRLPSIRVTKKWKELCREAPWPSELER